MVRQEDEQPAGKRPADPTPRIRQTRPSTLVVVVLAAAAIAWLGIDQYYGNLPSMPWLPPLTFCALSAAEGFLTWQVRAWLNRRSGAVPVEALMIARYVVLAKASVFVGAIFGGLYIGVTSWLLVQRTVLVEATRDLPAAMAGCVASALLMLCSILLERACRVPPAPDDRTLPPPTLPGL